MAFKNRLSPLKQIETIAPFLAGLMLIGSGGLAASNALGFQQLPPGPMGGAALPTALLVFGAGVSLFMAAWELARLRKDNVEARKQAQRADAERELAMHQARRMRAQTDGLALMREIHRSTAIPDRYDRLHRILSLVADLFDAREVTLYVTDTHSSYPVRPASYLSASPDEEIFLAFEDGAFDSAKKSTLPFPGAHARDSNMACEGCWLNCDGEIWYKDALIAKAQWRRTMASQEGAPPRQSGNELLALLLTRIEYGLEACREVRQSQQQRRTLRRRVQDEYQSGGEDTLILTVPLIAEQRSFGVLRIRRLAEGFDGPIAEALEETLIESAKHIALALKKDEDDRKAITDQLTSLYIKRHFLVTLEQLRAKAAAGVSEQERYFALLLCDIDHFKQVNDTHGHLSGDLILKDVARVLRSGLRTGDMAFRYGGEEMAILMPGATPEAAAQTAERLRAAIEKYPFVGEKRQRIPITISMGIARHQSGLRGQDLISRADQALYASKHGGRNRVTPWTKKLPDPLANKKMKSAEPSKELAAK